MKNKLIASLLVAVVFFITSFTKLNENIKSVKTEKQTEITFNEKEYNFGTIKQGDKASHFFTFKNTGKYNLIISRAIGSCGCTIPEYPKTPILPGKSGKMKVSFNSKGKSGKQTKTVSVYANVPKGGVTITIKANIKVKTF